MNEKRNEFVDFIRNGINKRIEEEKRICYSDEGTKITDEFLKRKIEQYQDMLNDESIQKILNEDSEEER